mgnify:FL=1
MEITLERQNILTENTLSEEVLEQAIDNEIMLPDFCGSMGRILKCSARGKIISKRIVNSVLNIDGNVFLTVFYIDENGCLKTFDQTLSFYRELNLKKDADITPLVKCKIEHISCRMLNPRKIEVHGSLSISIKLIESSSRQCIKSAKNDDIQLRVENRSITVPLGCTEKYMAVNDEIELPADSKPVTCLLRNCGRIEYTDCKSIAGKVIVKGELSVTVCYMTDEKLKVNELDTTIPFTQIIDIQNADEDCFARADCEITALDIRCKTGFDGEVQSFTVSAGINTRVKIFKNKDVDFAVDAYSVKNTIKTKCERICLNRNLADVKEDFSEEYTLDFGTELTGILDIFGQAAVTDVKTAGDRVTVNGTVQMCIIACDADGSVNCFDKTVDFSRAVMTGQENGCISLSPAVDIKSFGYSLNGSSADVKVNMVLTGSLEDCFDVNALSEISVSEENALSGTRLPALTVYYCYDDERLFDIARRYHTTVDAVKKANGTDGDTVLKGSVILIPGV